MATKVGPASAVSYGIGVQNRYSAFLDDDDGFASPASIIANSKRIAELNKQKAGAASSKPNNQSSHNNNNPSGGAKSSAKSASSSKQPDSKGAQQNDSRRNEVTKRSGGQQRQTTGPTNQGANNSVQSAPKQQHQSSNYTGNAHRYHQNGIAVNNKFSRATPSSGPNRMGNRNNIQQSGPLNKENNDAGQQQGQQGRGLFRQNNQRPIVKRSFNQDDRRAQPTNDDGTGVVIVQSNEEEKRRRQQKRALDMKHKDPEKREAKRQQSNQAAQSTDDGAADLASSPSNQGSRGLRGRRPFQDGERPISDEATRNLRGGLGMRNRARRPDGENGLERRENGNRGPRADRPPRNRNGFGQGSRGSRSDDPGKFGSEKQRPIPNFSDKSDFPSLAS